MNARELAEWIEREPRIVLDRGRETILRALRLLAAAEANNGIRAALEQVNRMESIGRPLSGEEQTVVRIINGLAARVAELTPDAERLDWAERQWPDGIHIEKCAIGKCGGDRLEPSAAVYVGDEFQADTIRAAIDAARSKP